MADGISASSKADLYAPGAEVEVWSKSDNAWCQGEVMSLVEGLATVEYTKIPAPDSSSKVVKALPIGHEDLRPIGKVSTSKSAVAPSATVEVWSNTDSKWCEGKVLSVEENIVTVEYTRDVKGSSSKVVKSLPLGHPDFRPSALPACSPSQDKPNSNASVTPAPLTLDQHSDFVHVCCMASILSTLSGAVNALAFLELGMPVAHHSGNANSVGRELGVSGWRCVPSIASFFLGSVFAGYGRCDGDAVFEGQASGGLLCSAGMVAAGVFVQLATGRSDLSVPLLAFSQGLQNGITTAFSGGVIRTTHVTGALVDAGTGFGTLFRAWRDGQQAPCLRKPMLNAILFMSFIAGGFIGACGQQLAGVRAALLPAAMLAFLSTGFISNRNSSKKHD